MTFIQALGLSLGMLVALGVGLYLMYLVFRIGDK